MELIDKDKLVAKINELKEHFVNERDDFEKGYHYSLNLLISFIDTLEVKEVDCEREIGIYTTKELLKKRNHSTGVFHLTQTDINSIAKHFFELGLKAKGE